MKPQGLPILAILLLLAYFSLMLPPSIAARPTLLVAKPGASVYNSTRGDIISYTIAFTLPPLTRLEGEQIACLRNANLTSAHSSTGNIEVRDGCVYLTASNTGLKELPVEVYLEAVESNEPKQQLPVGALVAVASVAAASYLTLTESGREKLFAAASIPVSYYLSRYEDIERSPKRVAILQYVKENPGASARRISRDTGISFGEVQWHLSVLERLGVVKRVRIGKYSCYFLPSVPLEEWLSNFMARELKAEVDHESLRMAKPRLEFLAGRGSIPYAELQTIRLKNGKNN